MTCEPKKSSLFTYMTLEVTKLIDGEVHVCFGQGCIQTLKSTDIMHIQHAVENAFHELLASLPDDASAQKKAG